MIPTIIQFGPLPVHSFGLMVALAMYAAMIRAGMSFEANGLGARRGEQYALIGTVVGLVGARLWSIGENWSEARLNLFAALISPAGFTFYGGFLLAFIVIVTLSRIHHIPFHALADSVGPALTICYLVGRLGCQLAGDGDYGVTTESFWGMSYGQGVVPTVPGVRVFPTPLFESAMCAVILGILVRAESIERWRMPFRRAGLYFCLISLERFLIEFLRVNPKVLSAPLLQVNLSEAQIIALGFLLFGGLLACRGFRRKESLQAT